jgi:outer membrane protein assembly factor BamB
VPGNFFRLRRSADVVSDSARGGSRLKIAIVLAVLALILCAAAAFFSPAVKRAIRSRLYSARRAVTADGITGFGEGHVRRLREHNSRVATEIQLTRASTNSPSPQSEHWSQFRGPGGAGHSTAPGLPLHWSQTDNVTWKTPIPGKGWSSPVTLGDRIYLTAAVPEGGTQELHVLELDAASGEIEWDATVFSGLVQQFAAIHEKNSYATPTPLVDGDRIYVHFGPHGTACLTADGGTVWKTRELNYDPGLGPAGSPVLVNGVLVINCDGSDKPFVAGLDADTGKIRWTTNRQPSTEIQHYAFSTPLVIDVDGKKQVVSSGASDANAFDPQTGADIWRVHYGGYSTVSCPLFGSGMVYLASGYSLLMAIRPDGHGDVTNSHVAWKQTRSIPKVPSALLVGDSLYLVEDNGIATCLDSRSGKPRWTHRIGGTYAASPLFAMGKIYTLSEDGDTTIFEANPSQYVQVAKNELNEQCLATPGVIDNALLIRTRSSLYRIENR